MTFDPYLKWLGIREKAPSHYRLLGVEEFENDLEVIRNAADRQMAHVRSFQLGPKAEICQKVLNQLAKSRAVLLKPETKQKYDLARRSQLTKSRRPPQVPTQRPHAVSTQPVSAGPNAKAVRSKVARAKESVQVSFQDGGRQAGNSKLLIFGLAAGLLLVIVGGIVMLLQVGGDEPDSTTQVADANRAARSVVPNKSSVAKSPTELLDSNINGKGKLDPSIPEKKTDIPTKKQGEPPTSPIELPKESGTQSEDPNPTMDPVEKEPAKNKKPADQTKADPKALNRLVRFENPKELTFKNTIYALALSPDKKFLAAAGHDKTVAVWRTSDWKRIAFNETDAPDRMFGISFSHDGKYVFTAGYKSTVMVLDSQTLEPVKKFKATKSTQLHRISLVPNSNRFNVLSTGGNLYTYDPEAGIRERRRIHSQSGTGIIEAKGSIFTTGSAKIKGKTQYQLSRFNEFGPSGIKVIGLPERPYRISIGRDEGEFLIPMATQAAIVNGFQNKLERIWALPNRERLNDFVYWQQRDMYLVSNNKGSVDALLRNQKSPVANNPISSSKCYQVIPLDDSTVITASGRLYNPVVVWKVAFDQEELDRLRSAEPDFDDLPKVGYEPGKESDQFLIADYAPIIKSPTPDENEIASAKTFVRDRYKKHYAAGHSAANKDLARLLNAYPANSIAMRWVLWSEAIEAAAAGRDPKTAIDTLAKLDKHFEIDFWSRAEDIVKTAEKGGLGYYGRSEISAVFERLVVLSVASNNFEMAQTYFEKVAEISRSGSYGNESKQKRLHYAEFEESLVDLKKIYKLHPKAEESLASNPTDKNANCRMGDYYFFILGDVDRAAEYWKKSNSPMKENLRLRSGYKTKKSNRTLADLWFKSIKDYNGFLAQKVAIRAKALYEKSKDSKDAEDATKVTQQLIVLTNYLEQMMLLSEKEMPEF